MTPNQSTGTAAGGKSQVVEMPLVDLGHRSGSAQLCGC